MDTTNLKYKIKERYIFSFTDPRFADFLDMVRMLAKFIEAEKFNANR